MRNIADNEKLNFDYSTRTDGFGNKVISIIPFDKCYPYDRDSLFAVWHNVIKIIFGYLHSSRGATEYIEIDIERYELTYGVYDENFVISTSFKPGKMTPEDEAKKIAQSLKAFDKLLRDKIVPWINEVISARNSYHVMLKCFPELDNGADIRKNIDNLKKVGDLFTKLTIQVGEWPTHFDDGTPIPQKELFYSSMGKQYSVIEYFMGEIGTT